MGLSDLYSEKNRLDGKIEGCKAAISKLEDELSNLRKERDELKEEYAKFQKLQTDIQTVIEHLNSAETQARIAKGKVSGISQSYGNQGNISSAEGIVSEIVNIIKQLGIYKKSAHGFELSVKSDLDKKQHLIDADAKKLGEKKREKERYERERKKVKKEIEHLKNKK